MKNVIPSVQTAKTQSKGSFYPTTTISTRFNNQSRICGKGVGLSLFPSDSLSFKSYEQFVRKSKPEPHVR